MFICDGQAVVPAPWALQGFVEEKIPKKKTPKNQSNKKASRDACAATICINFNLTDGGSSNQFYTTLLTTGKFLPLKHLINISPSIPHFAFP